MRRQDARVRELEDVAAATFQTDAAVATVSGSAAVLAVASCLATPGRSAIVPGWICSGVVYALIHAGLRPVFADVGPNFDADPDYVEQHVRDRPIGLAIYAPYGGNPCGIEAWQQWASRTQTPLVVDVAQAPDPAVWRRAQGEATRAVVTSFRAGKPLGAQGGGLIAGTHDIVERARLFLAGGRDNGGRKVAVGFELPLHPVAAHAARNALVAHPARVPEWRTRTRKTLRRLGPVLLPGWDPSDDIALSRIPHLGSEGTPLHPDPTYRTEAVRTAVRLRFGHDDQAGLPMLDALYNRVRVIKVTHGDSYSR